MKGIWQYIALGTYVVLCTVIFITVELNIDVPEMTSRDFISVEFTEPQKEEPPVEKKEVPKAEIKHSVESKVENVRQVSGSDTKTQTVNQRALFKMNKGGNDSAEGAGNPQAEQQENDLASGEGGGLNPIGNDALDQGLRGRGLVGSLPQPAYPGGNIGGRVVVRVTVNEQGRVVSAVYEPKGSTTSDSTLVRSAVEAAKKARFTESKAFAQGGLITYNFIIK